MKIKYFVFILSVFFFINKSDAQMHFGIRAGINYAKFLGPSEADVLEKFDFTSGFHFGLNFLYDLNDFVSIGTELTYLQNGSKYNFEGDSYYIFDTSGPPINDASNRYVERDSSKINLDFSNAYLHIPLTINVRTLEKWEFYGGAYVNILISPIGTGKWHFGTESLTDTLRRYHTFTQGQDHHYNSDRTGGFFGNSKRITLLVDETRITVPSTAGAYYLFPTAMDEIPKNPGNRFNSIDYGLILGTNYFINNGFYFGLRMEYGLRDLTNNKIDFSYKDVNDDGSLIFRNDKDTHFGWNFSMGFRF